MDVAILPSDRVAKTISKEADECVQTTHEKTNEKLASDTSARRHNIDGGSLCNKDVCAPAATTTSSCQRACGQRRMANIWDTCVRHEKS
eukprot:6461868-Amphidinium_carterae.1